MKIYTQHHGNPGKMNFLNFCISYVYIYKIKIIIKKNVMKFSVQPPRKINYKFKGGINQQQNIIFAKKKEKIIRKFFDGSRHIDRNGPRKYII